MIVDLRYLLLVLLHTTHALQNLTSTNCPVIGHENQSHSNGCEITLNGKVARFKSYHSTVFELEVLTSLQDVEEVYGELNGIETIVPAVTQNELLLKLHLSNNTIRNLSKNTFESTPNLQLLDMSFNVLAENDLQAFHFLSSLQTLNLSHNNITSISWDNFVSLISLEVLDLSHNSINSIDSALLSDHRNLRSLFLQNNRLESITLKIKSVQILDVSFNGIRHLNLPDVYRLNLSHNKLTEVSFNDIDIGLTHNALTSFKALANTRFIDASQNRIRVITDSFFSNSASVEYVALSGNMITGIDANALDTLTQLKVLNVSRNQMVDFKVRVFDKLESLEILDISHNFFMYLYEIPFAGSFNVDVLGKLNTIALNNNPWSCKFLKDIHTNTVALIGAHTTCTSDVNDFVVDFDKTVAIESEVDHSSDIKYDDFVKMLNKYLTTDFLNTETFTLIANLTEAASSSNEARVQLINLHDAVNTLRQHLQVDSANARNSPKMIRSNEHTASIGEERPTMDKLIQNVVIVNAVTTAVILLVIVSVGVYIICKKRKYKVSNLNENY